VGKAEAVKSEVEDSGRRLSAQQGRNFGRPQAIPEGVRKASTRIGEPIRFRARDWNGFFDWPGSGCCVAAISAFVTLGGGAAATSNNTKIKPRGTRIDSTFDRRVRDHRSRINQEDALNHTPVSNPWQSSIVAQDRPTDTIWAKPSGVRELALALVLGACSEAVEHDNE
jgi:hypothetical protein